MLLQKDLKIKLRVYSRQVFLDFLFQPTNQNTFICALLQSIVSCKLQVEYKLNKTKFNQIACNHYTVCNVCTAYIP